MSLILEALKKSEDKRRLGAAPDLATPFSAPRRRSWVWPLAALIVVAGVVAWALRPSTPPPTPPVAAVPPKSKAPVAQTTPTAGQKTGAPLRSITGNNDLVPAPPPDNLPKAAPSSEAPAGQFVFGQPGSTAATGTATEPRRGAREGLLERRAGLANRNASAATSKTPPPATVASTSPKANPPASAPAVAAPRANAVISPAPTPSVAAPAPSKAPVAAAPLPNQRAPVVASAQPADAPVASSRAPKSSTTIGLTPPPAAPAPSGATSNAQPYSELPFSTRKTLPDLKLSMHVYAADPSHRFVVLNDSRLTEGEKTNDDIFVREIRPDGVVLEFQNQRFFFPRDGL